MHGRVDDDLEGADLIGDTITLDIDGLDVRVLSLRRLIEVKQRAGRAKDLAALPVLRSTLERIEQQRSTTRSGCPADVDAGSADPELLQLLVQPFAGDAQGLGALVSFPPCSRSDSSRMGFSSCSTIWRSLPQVCEVHSVDQ